MSKVVAAFSDPEAVAHYAEGPPRFAEAHAGWTFEGVAAGWERPRSARDR